MAPGCRIVAVNGMKLRSQYKYPDSHLSTILVNKILVPSSSSADKRTSEIFSDIEHYLNSGDNLFVDLLRYTFILRYFSNNQIIAVMSLLDSRIPLNLHLTI